MLWLLTHHYTSPAWTLNVPCMRSRCSTPLVAGGYAPVLGPAISKGFGIAQAELDC